MLTAAVYVVLDFRHAIWMNSGLWEEPTEMIEALARAKALYRNGIFLMIPVVIGCWIWSSHDKKLILFLRKFRQDDVNRTLQQVIRQVLFRRFRLLTLDDATFHPIASSRRIQLAALVAVIISCATLVATFGTVAVDARDCRDSSVVAVTRVAARVHRALRRGLVGTPRYLRAPARDCFEEPIRSFEVLRSRPEANAPLHAFCAITAGRSPYLSQQERNEPCPDARAVAWIQLGKVCR